MNSLVVIYIGISILGVLIFLLIEYPKRYKKRVNEVLTSGNPVRTVEPTIVMLGTAIAILLILNIILLFSVTSLRDQINGLQGNVQSLTSQVGFTSSRVNSLQTTLNQMEREDDYVYNSFYTIKSIDGADDIEIDYFVELQNKPTSGMVQLVLRDEQNVVTYYNLTSETMTYQKSIVVEYSNYYTVTVVIDDGVNTVSESASRINVRRELYSHHYETDKEMQEQNEIFTFKIVNNFSQSDLLKITQVEVKVLNEDTLVDTIIYTGSTLETDTTQYFEITVDSSDYGKGEHFITVSVTKGIGTETDEAIEFFYNE